MTRLEELYKYFNGSPNCSEVEMYGAYLIENCVYDIVQTNPVEILINIMKLVEILKN